MLKNRFLIPCLWLLAITVPATAPGGITPDVSYLDAMPDVPRVLQDHEDPNPLKAVAMQHAALEVLRDAITHRTWRSGAAMPRDQFRPRTPAEEAKYSAYHKAWQKLHTQLYDCKPPACDKVLAKELWRQQGKFRGQTLIRYFKGPWLDEHRRISKARAEERQTRRRQSELPGFN